MVPSSLLRNIVANIILACERLAEENRVLEIVTALSVLLVFLTRSYSPWNPNTGMSDPPTIHDMFKEPSSSFLLTTKVIYTLGPTSQLTMNGQDIILCNIIHPHHPRRVV